MKVPLSFITLAGVLLMGLGQSGYTAARPAQINNNFLELDPKVMMPANKVQVDALNQMTVAKPEPKSSTPQSAPLQNALLKGTAGGTDTSVNNNARTKDAGFQGVGPETQMLTVDRASNDMASNTNSLSGDELSLGDARGLPATNAADARDPFSMALHSVVNATRGAGAHHMAHLDPNFPIGAPPTVRYFDWDIGVSNGAPDGFLKKQIMINGRAPGPTIECNEGDELVIRVRNLMDTGTSIHWHGMYQNSTPFMDGIAGFSQCPIPAHGQFEYRFRIRGQFGTFWYHSHSALQYTDGLYGALIVHSRNDPYVKGVHYHEEKLVLLADNYHDFADSIGRQLVSPKGYLGTAAAPSPQSALINGVGVYNCSKTQSTCQQQNTPTADVVPGWTYRLRIINAGSHEYNYVSVDDHELDVIAADGIPVQPMRVHRIPLHNGQRYDALVTMDQGSPGDSFLLRSHIHTACLGVIDSTLDPTANLTLQYKFRPSDPVNPPEPNDWSDALGTECKDLADDHLTPVIPEDVPENRNNENVGVFVTSFGFLNISSSTSVGRFFVNNVSYTNYINKPYLDTVHNGGIIDPKTLSTLWFDDDTWVADIIINNNDTAIDHPYHLHGMTSHLIKRGKGILTREEWSQTQDTFQLQNPMRRDTFVVPRMSHIVIRIFSDLPGFWPIHCHIAFHLLEGFMGGVVVHPKKIRELNFPPDVLGLCPTDAQSLNIVDLP